MDGTELTSRLMESNTAREQSLSLLNKKLLLSVKASLMLMQLLLSMPQQNSRWVLKEKVFILQTAQLMNGSASLLTRWY